jgi:hypothetical protein
MYKIEKKDYGVKLTFGGTMSAGEMKKWQEESKKTIATLGNDFGVLIDMRTLNAIDQETQVIMGEGQRLYKEKGMKRSAVILNSPTTTLQFKKIARQSGIASFERYIDASTNSNWELSSISWLKDNKDPDKK